MIFFDIFLTVHLRARTAGHGGGDTLAIGTGTYTEPGITVNNPKRIGTPTLFK